MSEEKRAEEVRRLLENAERPFFVFDKDCDGFCAYLLLRKFCGKGVGMPAQTSPKLDRDALGKIAEAHPDLVVVLDVPIVTQEFLDGVRAPVVWLDHHPPVGRRNVLYWNPKVVDPAAQCATTYLAWLVAQNVMWIAAVGCVADWFVPEFLPDLRKKYPKLIGGEVDPGKILYKTRLGELVKIFSFILKGKSADMKRSMEAAFLVEDPFEVLECSSDAGMLIWKSAEKQQKEYDGLLAAARKEVSAGKLFVFRYTENKTSFTKELANELVYLFPEKFIIVGREKGGMIKMSLRCSWMIIPKVLEAALVGVTGYGGGHDHACGGAVSVLDFDRFVENVEAEL